MIIKKLAVTFMVLAVFTISVTGCSGFGSNEMSYSTIVVPPNMAEEMEQDLIAAIEPYMSPDVIVKGTVEVGVVEFDQSTSAEIKGRESFTTTAKGQEPVMETFVTFRYPNNTRHQAEIRRALGMEPLGLINRLLSPLDRIQITVQE